MNHKEFAKKDSRLASGHGLCAGCAAPIILKTVLGATEKPVVVANATGCVEVSTTIYPSSAWKVPWIHSAFENAAATISGVEAAYRSLKKQGKVKDDIKFVTFGGDGGCYSEDTEIFTERGFIPVSNMRIGEKIWSVNPTTNELELTHIEKIFKYKVDGKMIRVKSRFIDFLVTPDHNVPIKHKNKYEFIDASDLLSRYKTPFVRSFGWKGKKTRYYYPKKSGKALNSYSRFEMKDWLKFLGWFITEGTLYKSKSGYLIRIYQSNATNRKEILRLLKGMGLPAFECNRSVDFQSKQIYEILLKECGKYSKNRRMPEWVLKLDKSLLKYIYETLMKGDGSSSVQKGRKTPHLKFITASTPLMNNFVELILKLGYNCSVGKKEDGIYRIGIDTLYLKHIIYSKRRLYEEEGTKQVFEERYRGMVYCPQLHKNHTVIIKRNNKVSLNGNSYDIGLQSISGALERGHDFLYVCYDNEAYENTGNQRSGSTPYGAATTTSPAGKVIQGKTEWKKDLMKIVTGHHIPYAAQASVGNWLDLANKAEKAFTIEGPKFLLVYSPCTTLWGFPNNNAINIAKILLETGAWPLYEVENGEYKLNYKPKERKPITEYLKTQRRFKHLFKPGNEGIIEKMQEHVDQRWEEILRLCGESE